MKKLSSLLVALAAVFAISCGGSGDKKAANTVEDVLKQCADAQAKVEQAVTADEVNTIDAEFSTEFTKIAEGLSTEDMQKANEAYSQFMDAVKAAKDKFAAAAAEGEETKADEAKPEEANAEAKPEEAKPEGEAAPAEGEAAPAEPAK